MDNPIKQASRFAITLTVICLAWVPATRAAEPVYQGKAISEWLVALQADLTDAEFLTARDQNVDPAQFNNQKHEQAREAIRQIGTNGLPVLLDLLSADEGRQWVMSGRIKSKEIQRLLRDSNPDSREVVREVALAGLTVLGTNAESAIPQLTKLMHRKTDCIACSFEVPHALLLVGPKGFATLTNIVNDTNDMARGLVISVLGEERGGDRQMITQTLINALNDPNSYNRGNAADSLGGRDAEVVIPVLIPLLDSYKDDFYTIKGVAHGLSSYGPSAKDAVPKLFNLYTNAVVNKDRESAGNMGTVLMWALQAIDKKAAEQAEEFLVNSGPLNYARKGYSQTKLTNGLELIAGGYICIVVEHEVDRYRYQSKAELLDPKTGKWTETGEMNTARYNHKAILQHDGKVLVVGGGGDHPPNVAASELTTQELYDPTTGLWTVVTNK